MGEVYGIRLSAEKIHELIAPHFSERFQVVGAHWDSDSKALKIEVLMLDRVPHRREYDQIFYFDSIRETEKVDRRLPDYKTEDAE